MLEIGMKVRFIPAYADGPRYTAEEKKAITVTGTVVYINWEHSYFTVSYELGGLKSKESFKFCGIGKVVRLRG